MRSTPMMVLITLLAVGCQPPPPAPEGLDASTSYLIRQFYADDASFQAGVQGFMDWFAEEGYRLVGEAATTSNTDSFTIGDLDPEDVAHLPLLAEVRQDDEGTVGPRNLGRAKGVVSLAELACDWTTTEGWLVRRDQHVVFDGDFEGYERTYLASREAFELASRELTFDPIDEPLDPFAEGFDGSLYERSLLRSDNTVDPTPVLFADLPWYDMVLDLRHGVFDVDGEPLGVVSILTFTVDSAWDESGANGLVQSYSVEINVEREGGKTLRMLAVWAEPFGAGIEPDSALALNYAVNKSLESSNRISAICAGDVDVPPEG